MALPWKNTNASCWKRFNGQFPPSYDPLKTNMTTKLALFTAAALLCAALSGCIVPPDGGASSPEIPEETTQETTEVTTRETAEETTLETTSEEPGTPGTPMTDEPISRPPDEETEPGATPPETTEPPLEITKTEVYLDESWVFADFSAIHTGAATLYHTNRGNGIVIGVNAGHGTKGGGKQKTYCHPDKTPKVTGGTTQAGATMSYSISTGMSFRDGVDERDVTLAAARILRDKLLDAGFDVLMLRDDVDVQLDNVARTVICNNAAACHISLHWDSDGVNYDKGAFYISVPEGIKYLENVAAHWKESERLGTLLVDGLRDRDVKIFKNGSYAMDLTQTAFSWIPSVDVELGNQCSDHSDEWLENQMEGLLSGIKAYFEQ